jgi:hypothetical protein
MLEFGASRRLDTNRSFMTTPTLLLTNAASLDSDGWALIAPFGEHPKTRAVRAANGQIQQEHFLQVLDNEAADAILASENSMFRRIKRALVGLTAYKGHPDLKRYSPETVENSSRNGEKPVPLGLVDKLRKTHRGIEAHFAILPDQAHTVENEGYKYPSVLWMVRPTGETRALQSGSGGSPLRGGHGSSPTSVKVTVVKPYQLLSIGLTPTPNIPGVDSLANASCSLAAPKLLVSAGGSSPSGRRQGGIKPTAVPAAVPFSPNIPKPQHSTTPPIHHSDPMKQILLGWLAAQGVSLANDVSDQSVLDAIQNHVSGRVTELTALSNERSTLNTKLAVLENENSNLATALANTQTELTLAKNDRAAYVVDLAIQRGILSVADREPRIIGLGNSADFKKDADALLKEAVKHKLAGTIPGDYGDRKAVANASMANPRDLLLGRVREKMAATKMSYKTAYAAVTAENPALVEAMKTASPQRS